MVAKYDVNLFFGDHSFFSHLPSPITRSASLSLSLCVSLSLDVGNISSRDS